MVVQDLRCNAHIKPVFDQHNRENTLTRAKYGFNAPICNTVESRDELGTLCHCVLLKMSNLHLAEAIKMGNLID